MKGIIISSRKDKWGLLSIVKVEGKYMFDEKKKIIIDRMSVLYHLLSGYQLSLSHMSGLDIDELKGFLGEERRSDWQTAMTCQHRSVQNDIPSIFY